MHVITRGPDSQEEFLGYDETGSHQWKVNRLDASRFPTENDARTSYPSDDSDVRVVPVDAQDGHYELYEGYEVQVFKDTGDGRWHYRLTANGMEEYDYVGFASYDSAMNAAKLVIDDVC